MKAFLLAGGLGTRLRPLTDTIPKCLVPIGGRPMLDIWLDNFRDAGVEDVLVNLHHHANLVRAHVEQRREGPRVKTVFEPELLGSGGTLFANREWIDDDQVALVCYADNLTDFDLRMLLDAHHAGGAPATLALFHAENPSACGVVSVDANGRMVAFTEKPPNPVGNLANAGMYAFNSAIFNEIGGHPPKDIGFDLLPRLVGRAQTIVIESYFRDIGTLDALRRAEAEWPSVHCS